MCVQESGLCVCGLCVVLLFAVLLERPTCPFLKPLRFLRLLLHFSFVFWRLLRDPFQGHPANTFAVLLATLVVDKQCLVACARRRGAERSKRIDGRGRGRDAHRNGASNNTRGATQKGTFRKKEKCNATEGRTGGREDGRTDGQRNSQKTTINQNSHTNTRNITFFSPQRSH